MTVKSKVSSSVLWANALGWWLVLPVLAGLLLFTWLPTLASLGLSLTDWDMLGAPQWVGLNQYQTLLTDPVFAKVMTQTLWFVVWVTGLEVMLGLWLALWLQYQASRSGKWIQWLSFTPVVATLVSVALVWGWIYDPATGLLNQILQWMGALTWLNGGQPMAWLYDERTALGALVALHVWKHVGYTVILFLAGLQAIPESVLEAAKLDGASGMKALGKITLPLLWPTVVFVVTVTLINTCQTFDSVYLLTRGGPNNVTTLWVFWLVKLAFEQFNIGAAAALGVLLFALLAGLGLLQRRFQQSA